MLKLVGPTNSFVNAVNLAFIGGSQTSTLALGLARRALDHLRSEANHRNELLPTTEKLERDWQTLWLDLLSLARGTPSCSNEEVRQRSNSLALRATQSALTASKDAGYLADHPASRWCREALFFLVWSCPRNVSQANLCEFAGLDSDR